MLAAVVVLSGAVAAGYLGTGGDEEPGLEVSVRALAAGPLSGRSEPAVAWSGEQLLVWGGRPQGRPHPTVADDGALHDVSTGDWQELPASPLGPRAGATAVWTGSEFLVWGGVGEDAAPDGLTDGAAYDPAADGWRSIPDSPAPGRVAARTAVFEDVVVFGGGADPVPGPRSEGLLWYEPATATWETTATRGPVYDMAATTDLIAVVQVDSMSGAFWLELVDPRTRTVIDEVLLDDARPQQLGVAPRGSGFVVAWTRDGETDIAQVDRDAVVQPIGSMSAEVFRPPVDVDGPLWGRGMLVVGDDLVAPSLTAVEVVSLTTGEDRRWELPADLGCAPQNTPWATGAASFIAWGGDSCDPQDPSAQAEGLVIELTEQS